MPALTSCWPSAAGIPAKFVSLGKIGHWLPDDIESILREAITWVETPVP